MRVAALKYLRKDPIIIGGCGRSGTSLLLSVLSAHPGIIGIPIETMIFSQQRRFANHKLNKVNHYRKLLSHIRMLPLKGTAYRWCEKTPRNVRFFHTINREFKGRVKLIHIIRDGRDVITSSHPQLGENYISTQRWIKDVRSGLSARDLSNLCEVKYEDLVTRYESTVKHLLNFLGEPFHTDMLVFHKRTNVNKHLAFNDHQVKEISSDSVNKWKRAVHKEVIEDFYKNKEAITLLKELGYSVKSDV